MTTNGKPKKDDALDDHPIFDVIRKAQAEIAQRLRADPNYDPFTEDTPGRRRFLAELDRLKGDD